VGYFSSILRRYSTYAHAWESENASSSQIWAYRKAAWAVEDLEQDVGLVYRSLGRKGLESIPGISLSLAGEIEALSEVK
jgi:DNA polymerase/3'-5' exonuclease PolX